MVRLIRNDFLEKAKSIEDKVNTTNDLGELLGRGRAKKVFMKERFS